MADIMLSEPAAVTERGLFRRAGLLAVMDSHIASLFTDRVRRGPAVLNALPTADRLLVQHHVANAFREVFLTVACFACTIVACAATMKLRRLKRQSCAIEDIRTAL